MFRLEYCPVVGRGSCNKSEIEVHFKRDTFFLAEPFTTDIERERRELAIKNSLRDVLENSYSGESLRYADKEPRETSIFCDICRLIQSSEYGIADLSGLNPNVLIELGM